MEFVFGEGADSKNGSNCSDYMNDYLCRFGFGL